MNESETFLFMADGHVRGRTWTNTMLLQGDAYAALGKLGECSALTDTLVVGGDWFDSNRPSSRDVEESLACLKRFARVYYIKGNHDGVDPAWLGGLLPSAVHLTQEPQALYPGAYICGQDWVARRDDAMAGIRRMAENAASLTDCRRLYVVLHDAMKETLGFDGTYLCTADELYGMFDGVTAESVTFLAGHVHKSGAHLSGRNMLLSPGPLYPTAADQMFNDSLVQLLDTATNERRVLSVNVRVYHRHGYRSDAELAEECRRAVEVSSNHGFPLPPAVIISVPADSDVTVRVPPDSGVVPLVVREVDQQHGPTVAAHAATARAAQGMLDAIQEAASYDETIRDMAAALYECDDPIATIDGWLDHWGAVKA